MRVSEVFKSLYLVLAVSPILGCGMFEAGPAAVSQRFLRSVENGEIEKASQLIESSLASSLGDKLRMGLAEQSREMRAKGGIERIEVVNDRITGELAEVVLQITFGNGESTEDRFKLVREGGKWRLSYDK